MVRRPTENAQSKIFAFTPDDAVCITRARTFSKIRGAPAMKVGWMTARFSTILSIRPSTAVENPIRTWMAISALPNTWLSGSHRY